MNDPGNQGRHRGEGRGRHGGEGCGQGLGAGQGQGKGMLREVRIMQEDTKSSQAGESTTGTNTATMRVAIPTEDGTHVAQHLGRAGRFVILEVQDGAIVSRKDAIIAAGPHHGGHGSHDDHHTTIRQALADASVVLVGGAGRRIVAELVDAGMQVEGAMALTIEESIAKFLAGERRAVESCAGHGPGHEHGAAHRHGQDHHH